MDDLLTCPACGAQLRSSPDIPPGEDVRCPRCDIRFTPPPPPPAPPPSGGPPREAQPGEYASEPIPPTPPAGSTQVETGYGKEGALPPARPRHESWDEDDDLPPRRPRDGEDEDDGDREPRGLEGLSDEYTVNMGEWFGHAKAHWGAVLGPMIGFFIIVQVISFALGLIPRVGWLVQFLVDPPLQAGFVIVALAELQGRPWTFGDFFGGFQKFGSILAYTLLTALCFVPFALVAGFCIAIAAVGQKEFGEGALIAAIVGGVVLLVVAIYIAIRVGTFGVLLIIDRGCGGAEAIRGSWRMTRGHVLELFAVNLVLGLMALAGVLALCVGVLFVIPFIHLTWAAGYLLIAGRRPPVDPNGYGNPTRPGGDDEPNDERHVRSVSK